MYYTRSANKHNHQFSNAYSGCNIAVLDEALQIQSSSIRTTTIIIQVQYLLFLCCIPYSTIHLIFQEKIINVIIVIEIIGAVHCSNVVSIKKLKLNASSNLKMICSVCCHNNPQCFLPVMPLLLSSSFNVIIGHLYHSISLIFSLYLIC